MARFQPVGEQFRIAMQGSLEQVHKSLVDTAKREHARVMTTDPRPTSFRRFVDGSEGRIEEQVKPAGVIVYQYPRIEEVVQFALETLFDLSPVLTGAYRSAHVVFIENSPTANLKDWKSGQEITITNPLPYARKIEVGNMTMRVPGTSRVYQQAKQLVQRRWGNVARIQFTYRAIIGGMVAIQERASAKGRTSGRAATGDFERQLAPSLHNRADLRFPCLVISER